MMQTSGDMTVEKWMKATMLLAGGVRPRTLTLALSLGFTADIMAVVAKYLRLEWIVQLRLLTPTPLTAADINQLADLCQCNPADLLGRLELAAEPDAHSISDLMLFQGTDGTVAIQGPMTAQPTNAYTLYAALYARTDTPAARTITDTFMAHFRSRRYELELPSPAVDKVSGLSDSGEEEAVPELSISEEVESSSQKSRTRKKK